jgi:hypothetical protein
MDDRILFIALNKRPAPGSFGKEGGEKVPSFAKQKVASSAAFFF